MGKRLLAPGVLVGAGLAFFATAMRFAAALAARGHVLPSVEQSGKSWTARWIAAPTAGEHEQIASLVRAMPPAAAVLGTKHDAAPRTDRRAVVESFLGAVVDCLLRGTGTRSPAPATSSLHDRWLAALISDDGALAGDGDAHRFVLGSLADAAALSRAVDDALRRPAPSEVATDATGALAFLTNGAASLESSGFGCPATLRPAA